MQLLLFFKYVANCNIGVNSLYINFISYFYNSFEARHITDINCVYSVTHRNYPQHMWNINRIFVKIVLDHN